MQTFGALCAASALLAASPASATITETYGGPGGRDFELRCPPGAAMVGTVARAGSWIDGVGILCSTERRNQRQEVGWAGGNGGPPQEEYCHGGGQVSGLRMTFTRGNGLEREYLNSLAMRCADGRGEPCISTGEGCYHRDGAKHGMVGGEVIMADAVNCPDNEVVVGIVGRAGKYVDALAAICEPASGTITVNPQAGSAAAEAAAPVAPPTSMNAGGIADQSAATSSALPSSTVIEDGGLGGRDAPPPADKPR